MGVLGGSDLADNIVVGMILANRANQIVIDSDRNLKDLAIIALEIQAFKPSVPIMRPPSLRRSNLRRSLSKVLRPPYLQKAIEVRVRRRRNQ